MVFKKRPTRFFQTLQDINTPDKHEYKLETRKNSQYSI